MKFLVQGYLSQLVGVFFLVAYNFLLPVIVGFEEYGKLVYISGSSYLIISLFDYGYNLRCVKKINRSYLYAKYIFVGVFSSVFGLYFISSSQVDSVYFIVIVVQTFLFVSYTYYSHMLVSLRRNDISIVNSLINGVLLFATPMAFSLLGMPIELSVVVYFFLSIVVVRICIHKVSGSVSKLEMGGGISVRFLRTSFLTQIKRSVGNFYDSFLTWAGVIFLADFIGEEDATAFRISISIVALLVLVVPLHRQTFYKEFVEHTERVWIVKYLVVLLGSILILLAGALIFSGEVLGLLYPSNSILLLEYFSILVFIFPLKVIIELLVLTYEEGVKQRLFIAVCFFSAILFLTLVSFVPISRLVLYVYLFLVVSGLLIAYWKNIKPNSCEELEC